MKKNYFKRENGAALVIAMILIVVIPIFIGAIMQYSLSAQKSVMFKKRNTQAYYLARAGAEATIEAWKRYDVSEKPEFMEDDNTIGINKLYLTNDGNFVRTKPQGKYIGSVEVTVKRQDDQTTTFTAVADVNDIKQTVTATVVAHVDGGDTPLNWYDSNSGEINPGPDENIETVEVDSWLNNLLGITQAEISYHDPIAGIVECGRSSLTMSLRNDNDKNKVAYIADTIIFNSELNLMQIGRQGALITSGENIIFNKPIRIDKGTTSYGSLILNVTDGMGIKLKNRDGLYGKVYFNGDVIKREYFLFFYNENTLISAGSYYYFKKMEKGIDLLEISDSDNDGIFEDSNGNEVLIPIPSDDENRFVPEPEDELRVMWN